MAAGNVARIIRAPGRVIVGPTEAFDGGTYPYGGTEVGKTNAVVLQPLGSAFRVEYESLGEAGDILNPNNQYVFTCFLRGWDDDAVAQFFAGNVSTGSPTQHSVFTAPGALTPGASALGRAVVLVYVPDDIIHVPAIIVYRGVPDWDDGAELAWQRGSELGIPLALECMRNTSNNILRIGRLDDLSLT